MATFKVRFNSGRRKDFTVSKTLDQVKTMIQDAIVAGEMIKVGNLLILPQNITEVEEIT